MNQAEPRHHLARSPLRGVGLPGDRLARLAARRAFVNLKQTYLLAIAAVADSRAAWLRQQIRRAEDPADLWLLRAAVFDALAGADFRTERDTLQRGIDSLFPRNSTNSGFSALF